MGPDERQYELAARELDARAAAPDAPLGSLAEQVLRDEVAASARLDVPVPPRALAAARRRMAAGLRARRSRAGWLALTAAAAAALVVAAWLAYRPAGPQPPRVPAGTAARVLVPAHVVELAVLEASAPELDLLAMEIDELQAEMAVSATPAPMDLQIESLQRDVDELLTDGPLRALEEALLQPS